MECYNFKEIYDDEIFRMVNYYGQLFINMLELTHLIPISKKSVSNDDLLQV